MPVSARGWVSESVDHIRTDDGPFLKRLIRPVYFVYVSTLLSISRHYPLGTNVFEKDWDLLVVLDACRVDAIETISKDYDFISEIDSIRSVGSTSFEWMPLTFTNEYLDQIRETTYITGNPYTERVLAEKDHPPARDSIPFGPTEYDVVRPDDFDNLIELWRYESSENFNRTSPRFTTDHAIRAGRSRDSRRFIVHYMYPHNPYPLAPDELQKPFEKLRRGDVSRETVWGLYLENLRFVLNDVKLLLANFDADNVVITADHGEAFGEFGFYKHDIGCPLPSVRHVPWIETKARDTYDYEPDESVFQYSNDEAPVEQRLADLGYL